MINKMHISAYCAVDYYPQKRGLSASTSPSASEKYAMKHCAHIPLDGAITVIV